MLRCSPCHSDLVEVARESKEGEYVARIVSCLDKQEYANIKLGSKKPDHVCIVSPWLVVSTGQALAVYQVLSANLEFKLSIDDKVTCLYAWNGKVFVGTAGGKVHLLDFDHRAFKTDFKFDAKQPIKAIACFNDTLAVAQVSTISLFDLKSASVSQRIKISADFLAFTGRGLLVTASRGDYAVQVWDVKVNKKQPLFTASLPEYPDSLSSNGRLVAVVAAGKCSLFQIPEVIQTSKKPVSLSVSTFSFSSAEEPVRLVSISVDSKLLTVRGEHHLVIESLSPLAADGNLLSGTIEREPPIKRSVSVLEGEDKKSALKKKKRKLGEPEIISGATAPSRTLPDAKLASRKPLDVNMVFSPDTPNAMTNLLLQALQSGNPHLLESAFTTTSEEMIMESIERLPEQLSVKLLEELISRLVKRPNRALQLSPWIQAVFVCHEDYLRASPDRHKVMQPLLACISRIGESRKALDALALELKRRETEIETAPVTIKKAPGFVRFVDCQEDSDSDSVDDRDHLIDYNYSKVEDATPSASDTGSDDE